MRYQQGKSVREVLAWLELQGVPTIRRNYHRLMLRVFLLLPLDQARELGVDEGLLRAVRTRYKLPVDPGGRRAPTVKKAPRRDYRQRQRRILADPRPKRASPPALEPHMKSERFERPGTTASVFSPGISSMALASGMRGTPENPEGY